MEIACESEAKYNIVGSHSTAVPFKKYEGEAKRLCQMLDGEMEWESVTDLDEEAPVGHAVPGFELQAWETRFEACSRRLDEWGLEAALEQGDYIKVCLLRLGSS